MEKPLILVTMGTNDYPFTRLYNYIKKTPLYSDDRCQWFVQTGSCDVDVMPASGVVKELIPRPEMEDLVRRSALVISHCGIGSLNLMLAYRKQVIFVPRVARHGEFSDDHQLQIAAEIKNSSMQIIYPEDLFPELTLDQLSEEDPLSEPVDITNYELARIINFKLTG